MYKTLFSLTALVFLTAINASAQQRAPRSDIIIDERAGLPIPKNAADLRNNTLETWQRTRKTNQSQFNFSRETAEFRAYLSVCRRHDLKVDMKVLSNLALRNIQQILLAHYEEPEFVVLEAMTQEKQANFVEDVAADIYAFEYGTATATMGSAIETSGNTRQTFCTRVADENFQKYVALRTIAQRQQTQSRQ